VLLDLAALQRENAEQRVQIAAILATNRQLVAEVAKLNDRVAELLAVAQRKQRKPAGGPSDKKPSWKRSPGSAAKRSRIRRSRDRQDERARRRMSEGGRAVVGA